MRRTIFLLAIAVAVAGCAAKQAANEARVSVTDNGFEPAVVVLHKGSPATLVITRKTDATCATEAVFAGTGKSYPLPLNQEVRIPIPATAAETLAYACGMGMYHGKVVVQ